MTPRIPAPSARPRLLAGLVALALGGLALTGCASSSGSTRHAGNAAKAASTTRDEPTQSAQAAQPAAEQPQPGSGGDDASTRTVRASDEDAAANAPYRPATLPRLTLTPPILYELLVAEVALQRQQPGAAYANYHALATQTGDARLARRATEIALVANAFADALDSARLWQKLDPASPDARQTLDTLLLANGRIAEAEPALASKLAEARQQGDLANAYPRLQRQLLGMRNHRDGWAAIQRLSAPDLQHPAARLARAHLAAAAGERQAAADEALEARRLAPDDTEALLACAQFLQPLPGGPQRAEAMLQDHLRKRPDDTAVLKALGLLQIAADQTDAAITTLDKVLTLEPDTSVVLYTLAQLHHKKQHYDQATDYLKRYVELPDSVPRDNAPAYLFLAEIAEAQNTPAAAIDWLERIPAQSPFQLESLARRAVLTARQSRPEAGLALLDSARPRNAREKQLLLVTRSQILRDAGRHQQAFEVIDKAVRAGGDNTDLLYDHAIAAEKINRLDILEKSLRTLIKRQPDSGHAYNALGYTLADRNIRLPEALELIQQANRLMPNNAHVLDSLGWVLYRMGRIPEALIHLRQAYELQPDPEVATHYGEVLWVSGQRDQARALWQKASERAPDNPLLRDTLKRLGVSL